MADALAGEFCPYSIRFHQSQTLNSSMLRELNSTRQIPGERPRRWFSSANMDLIIWIDTAGNPDHFELCFDKTGKEHCLRWSRQGHAFHLVDSGESYGGYQKATPIHRERVELDAERLLDLFLAESISLPITIKEYVLDALRSLS